MKASVCLLSVWPSAAPLPLGTISNHLLSKISEAIPFSSLTNTLTDTLVSLHTARLALKAQASYEHNFKNSKIHNVSNLAFSEANCSAFDRMSGLVSFNEGGNSALGCILSSVSI